MLREYLQRIGTVGQEKFGEIKHRRIIFGQDPRTTLWGNPDTLQGIWESMPRPQVYGSNYETQLAEKAKAERDFETSMRKLAKTLRNKSGEIDKTKTWPVSSNMSYSPHLLLMELGALAFVNGRDGGEAFFTLGHGDINVLQAPISYEYSRGLLDNFYGKDAIKVHNLSQQAREAGRAILEWVSFERWLSLFYDRELRPST